MPKGVIIVDWKETKNTERLIAAIAQSHNLDASAVAHIYGDNVPAACISRRLNHLRGQYKSELGSAGPRAGSKENNAGAKTGTVAASNRENGFGVEVAKGGKRKRGNVGVDVNYDEEHELGKPIFKRDPDDRDEDGGESDETIENEPRKHKKMAIKGEDMGDHIE